MHLLYDLPDDIIREIYKKLYSNEVLTKLNKYGFSAGDFSFYLTDYSDGFDMHFCDVLTANYSNINKIGPEAWNCLKHNTMYSICINKYKYDIMTKIDEAMEKNVEHFDDSYIDSLRIMIYIAKIGWEKYVV